MKSGIFINRNAAVGLSNARNAFLSVLLLVGAAQGATVNLELKRVILVEPDLVVDSYIVDLAPRGTLTIETDEANIIRGLEYDVWIRGDTLLRDKVNVLSYSNNGARYEVYSLLTDERYTIRFIRRAPLNDSYDPATIFMLELDDGSLAFCDYRYTE